MLPRDAFYLANHPRRLAEKDLDVHVDGLVREVAVGEDEPSVASRLAYERDGAALAAAKRLEEVLRLRLQRENVALLRLAAPDFHRVHGNLLVVDFPKLEPAARGLNELGAAVGKSARADVVD